MEQDDIAKITNKILALNDDPAKLYEFIAACANAKAMLENNINATLYRQSVEASMKSMINLFSKGK